MLCRIASQSRTKQIVPSKADLGMEKTEKAKKYLGVEGNSGDKVDVLEAAETLGAGDVPQANRLVHRR